MSVEELVKKEPWRRGVGQPDNALDPTWNAERSLPCSGDIIAEEGTGWWWCAKCGYCGKGNIHAHRPVQNPMLYLMERLQEYLGKRSVEGIETAEAIYQAAQIAGMAIGYAGSVKTEQLKDYLDRLKIR